MSMFTRIRDYFCPPKLRNRAGGMAFIKHYGEDWGAGAIAGHVVKTVRLRYGNQWEVDPPQPYTLTADCTYGDQLLRRGARVTAIAIADDLLEPIRNPGDDERSEELAWQPKVPASEPGKVAA